MLQPDYQVEAFYFIEIVLWRKAYVTAYSDTHIMNNGGKLSWQSQQEW